MRLFLASRSPQRRAILKNLGFETVLLESPFTEIIPPLHPDPPSLARHVAEQKMAALPCRPAGSGILITADTLVYQDCQLMGKPADEADARRMLLLLSGVTHAVVTAICLQDLDSGRQMTSAAVTEVEFDTLAPDLLANYLLSGEWRDKAGAYGIQGKAALFVRGINGCYFNVVGFPVNLFYHLLKLLWGDPLPIFPASNQ
ncbi:MAG: septum formation protein Maf [Acidobacteria bacterium]|nr:septum formation protein Maf [Acidobacteriota bacterium]